MAPVFMLFCEINIMSRLWLYLSLRRNIGSKYSHLVTSELDKTHLPEIDKNLINKITSACVYVHHL